MPFADALEHMPSYVKFMKDILANKRKLADYKTNDHDPLLIRKQEPWYMRTPQSVMEIRLISLWNEDPTINYGKVD